MLCGAVAQLVERQLCKLDVVGSTPISSTQDLAGNSSPGAQAKRAGTKHSDNRIRRVIRASHSEVSWIPTPKVWISALNLGAARAFAREA